MSKLKGGKVRVTPTLTKNAYKNTFDTRDLKTLGRVENLAGNKINCRHSVGNIQPNLMECDLLDDFNRLFYLKLLRNICNL